MHVGIEATLAVFLGGLEGLNMAADHAFSRHDVVFLVDTFELVKNSFLFFFRGFVGLLAGFYPLENFFMIFLDEVSLVLCLSDEVSFLRVMRIDIFPPSC